MRSPRERLGRKEPGTRDRARGVCRGGAWAKGHRGTVSEGGSNQVQMMAWKSVKRPIPEGGSCQTWLCAAERLGSRRITGKKLNHWCSWEKQNSFSGVMWTQVCLARGGDSGPWELECRRLLWRVLLWHSHGGEYGRGVKENFIWWNWWYISLAS